MKGRDVQWIVEARSYSYNLFWSIVNIISFLSNLLIWRLLRNYYKKQFGLSEELQSLELNLTTRQPATVASGIIKHFKKPLQLS